MSSSPELYTLHGSCHCGTIKFIAKNVNLDTVGKCNCTFDNKDGKIFLSVRGPEDVLILKGDQQIPLTLENVASFKEDGLTSYIPIPERFKPGEHEVHHCFCSKCGNSTFSVLNVADYGGKSISISARLVDFGAIGKDIKDVTDPKRVTYLDGLTDKWGMQKGEPWAGGAW
ncbi:hypothetical protein DL96DRAFT_1812595 [Flagelloscypha sp. PMI_526]|nr:hypothetical protein DL96DRAFT_1812595 [Flagelloscypha sp. PMI_526]